MTNRGFENRLALVIAALLVAIAFAVHSKKANAQESSVEFFRADQERQATPAPPRRGLAARTRPRDAQARSLASYGRHIARQGVNLRGVSPTLLAFAREFNLTIISGFRPGARVRGTGRLSNHARGTAIDARGGRIRAAIQAARARGMGVGTYARCTGYSHVHFSLSRAERYHASCSRKRGKKSRNIRRR